ncbi:hypothetical protein Hte_010995 [Hypoxylon texense]
MPSKGIYAYAYNGVPGCSVEFGVPGSTIIKKQLQSWSMDHLEVDSSKIPGHFDFVGRFYFKVFNNGKEIVYEYNCINSRTGNLHGGTMTSIRDTKCHRVENLIITYGFYDAGSGVAGLTNKDQCWVAVTQDRSDWMGTVSPVGSPASDRLFSTFCLPCPHDCGMNSMQSADLVIDSPALKFLAAAMVLIPIVGDVVAALLAFGITTGQVSKIVYGLAITQKESLEDTLAIGARYFEFRPGRFPQPVRDQSRLGESFYFMHACIPGMSYDEFLDRCLGFLRQHPQEIIVVQLRSDGILDQIEKPNAYQKMAALKAALERNPGVVAGSLNDMRTATVKQLRDQSMRLIVVDEIDQYSSYSDAAYATLDGKPIVKALDGMTAKGQEGKPMTLLQCQATATNVTPAFEYSIIAANASTSILMSTKAACDIQTHPWLAQNVIPRLTNPELVTIMNDFFDGATVDVAVELSKKRFGK